MDEKNRTTGKVLIVDDNAQIRELLEKFLTLKGYRTVTAIDGEDAIARVVQEKPDVVLLDIKLPGMDGITVMKKIREINSQQGVIMITGVKEEQIAREAMEAGAFDYIVKPFDLNYLELSLITKLSLL